MSHTLVHYDVAVVGGGAAGLFAAIFAGRAGQRVLVLDGAKKLGAKILVAGGGRCNVTHHAVDPADYAGDKPNRIRKVLRRFDVADTIDFFREQGVELKREETGKLFPVTDKARSVLDALLNACSQAGVTLAHPQRVEAVERREEDFLISGDGAGKAWRVTSNSWEYTGDGYGMAARAGAELMDMEFTQFHPTGMVWPPSVRGILVTEGVRGEGGILTNSDGVRFMFDNIPERFASETADTKEEGQRWLDGDREARRPPELLTRDVVARAIMREVKSGRGSEHGGAYLDISHRDSDFVKRKLPSMYHQFKELAEVDITAQPMEVGPTLHYYMGGIRVDGVSQMTSVPGLFAAGECSAGLHGANRLGGNSLSDLIVFGARAGMGAKEYLDNLSGTPTVQEEQVHQHMRGVTDFLNREDGENPYVVVDDLQKIMELNVGIVREGKELEEGIEALQQLKKRADKVKAHPTSQYNPGWNTCIDLRNMITSAEATALCALQREESRGAHTRLDFEGEREDGLTYNGVVRLNESGELEVRKELRKDAPEDLQKIAHSTLEELEGNRV